MPRPADLPTDFDCPYKHRCPHLEGLSTHGIFRAYQDSRIREHEHWLTRESMSGEILDLERTVREQAAQIDQLQAENRRLHQRGFKARTKPADKKTSNPPVKDAGPTDQRQPRGAPKGHPPWNRKEPEVIDLTRQAEAPCSCPHCQSPTDPTNTGLTAFVQEDIVLQPKTVVTRYVHPTAWCPTCRRQVIQPLEGELPFAPIGPRAKAAALYLRHEMKLPYRKIQEAMSALFGLDFVPSSTLGFELRARQNADPFYEDLIQKLRHASLIHADETHWRQDGENHFVWYAGNQDLALFHIDAHRSAEAAQVLLGARLEALLVTDAYASYNAITVTARQSCLAHLLRRAKELIAEMELMKQPEAASLQLCRRLKKLFQLACRKSIPPGKKARQKLTDRFLRVLDRICEKPVTHPKAETFRKRFLPTAREHREVFAFIESDGPPTNNHAERALRPLVIFRKICLGTRSDVGSENLSVFASLTQTAKLQNTPLLETFESLLTGSPAQVQDLVFNDSA